MKIRILLSMLALGGVAFAQTPAPAAAAPAVPALPANAPSAESIKELLEISHARSLVDQVTGQVDNLVKASTAQAYREHPGSPEAEKIINGMQAKVMDLMKQELSWDVLEPMYIRVYQQSFTQDEVNGLIAFYRTPVGQSLVEKMPKVMQLTMAEMQQRIRAFMPQAQRIAQETMGELKALEAKNAAAAKPASPAAPAAPAKP